MMVMMVDHQQMEHGYTYLKKKESIMEKYLNHCKRYFKLYINDIII